jgi:hypothetical protein
MSVFAIIQIPLSSLLSEIKHYRCYRNDQGRESNHPDSFTAVDQHYTIKLVDDLILLGYSNILKYENKDTTSSATRIKVSYKVSNHTVWKCVTNCL